MIKINLKLLITFTFFISFGILLVTRANAQNQDLQGAQCVEVFQESCPTGTMPIEDAIERLSYSGLNSEQFEESIRETYGASFRELCFRQDYSNIFRAYVSQPESNGDAYTANWENESGIFTRYDSVAIPRACDNGWNLQSAPNSVQNEQIYGCCPSGLTFVNRNLSQIDRSEENDEALNLMQGGVCCRIPSGASGAYWDPGRDSCFYQSGGSQTEVRFGSGTGDARDGDSRYETTEQVLNNVSNINYFEALNNQAEFSGKRPQLGRNLGPRYLQEVGSDFAEDFFLVGGVPVFLTQTPSGLQDIRFVAKEIDSAPFKCADAFRNGCMIDSNGNSVNPALIANGELTENICSECFLPGEPIAVQEGQLLMCRGNGETFTQGLVNGNIQDTLAYLNSDDANRDLLRTCRERGGLYLAIGCIEPTPVGIITGLIRIGFGVMGGVALVMIILAGLAYQSGDEAKIEEARKRVMSVFAGLAVLIFSVLILRIIGINVLDVIPEGSV